MTSGVSIDVVPWEDDDAARLRAEQQAELVVRYDGVEDIEPDLPPDQMVATVLVKAGDEVAGCGSLRALPGGSPGVGELKRMYVRPAFRGRGLSRAVLAELERIAVERGFMRLVLETGVRQPEAIALYRSAGYRRIANFGPYVDEPTSRCYARWLVPDAGTRVLVVNGTMGAGKTTIASAVADLLREREVPHAWVDVDALCQVWPTTPGDPFAQGLVFEQLAVLAPGLAARGLRHVVLPRVVEDADDRERYEQAFDGADVVIVRVDASVDVRVARLAAREPEGYWQDFALARTRELAAVLERLDLDDAVVLNEGRSKPEVAADVLAAAGWPRP